MSATRMLHSSHFFRTGGLGDPYSPSSFRGLITWGGTRISVELAASPRILSVEALVSFFDQLGLTFPAQEYHRWTQETPYFPKESFLWVCGHFRDGRSAVYIPLPFLSHFPTDLRRLLAVSSLLSVSVSEDFFPMKVLRDGMIAFTRSQSSDSSISWQCEKQGCLEFAYIYDTRDDIVVCPSCHLESKKEHLFKDFQFYSSMSPLTAWALEELDWRDPPVVRPYPAGDYLSLKTPEEQLAEAQAFARQDHWFSMVPEPVPPVTQQELRIRQFTDFSME